MRIESSSPNKESDILVLDLPVVAVVVYII